MFCVAISDLLKWDGLNTGFRSFSSLFESCKSLKSQQAKQDNRSSNARMEDISRKITILLKSLVVSGVAYFKMKINIYFENFIQHSWPMSLLTWIKSTVQFRNLLLMFGRYIPTQSENVKDL